MSATLDPPLAGTAGAAHAADVAAPPLAPPGTQGTPSGGSRARAWRTLHHTFRSLRVRNYRLYFAGQTVSVSGSWMQMVALSWLVLRLTDSGVLLGVTLALQYIPLLVIGPWAGVVVDRRDKRRLLFATQSALGGVSLLLGVLTVTGTVQVWSVLAASFALGLATAFDVPARQALAYELVGRDLLPNAVTLNSVLMNVGRLAGPAVGAIIIARFDLGWCFVVNAATFFVLVAMVAMMRPGELERTALVPRQPGQLREGFRYVWATPAIRTSLVVVAVIGTFTYEFQVNLPLLARYTFGADASGYSLLLSTMAVGAIAGGLVSAATVTPSARSQGIAGFALGALVVAVALMPNLGLAAALLVPTGAMSIAFITISNATLQLTAAPEMRGRVVALVAVAFLGSIPVGGPIIGWVAEVAGPRASLALGGIVAMGTVALAWSGLREHTRVPAHAPAEAAQADAIA